MNSRNNFASYTLRCVRCTLQSCKKLYCSWEKETRSDLARISITILDIAIQLAGFLVGGVNFASDHFYLFYIRRQTTSYIQPREKSKKVSRWWKRSQYTFAFAYIKITHFEACARHRLGQNLAQFGFSRLEAVCVLTPSWVLWYRTVKLNVYLWERIPPVLTY